MHRILVALAGMAIVLCSTLYMKSASFLEGRYLPVGHDAFYHAARIEDAMVTGQVAQFDPHIHAPEGDWVTWPWSYDASIAALSAAFAALTGSSPSVTMMHVPVMLGMVGVALVLALCVLLRLSVAWTGLAVACFALHGFTQYQFGVGALDHHGAEQLCVLATLCLGIFWLDMPRSPLRASSFGLSLGLALGVHAGLIFLQVPFLAVILLEWIVGRRMPLTSSLWFAGALLTGALLILGPAQTFWQPRFQLYYLSGLHAYVTTVTAVLVVATSRWACSRRSALVLCGLALLAAVPMLATIRFSAGFVTGSLARIAIIDEIRSPFALVHLMGVDKVSGMYTLLIWIAPLTCLFALVQAFRETSGSRRFFWIWSAFGLGLLMMQHRLGSLGAQFLYLPLVAQGAALEERLRVGRIPGAALAGLVLLIAYAPTLRYQLFEKKMPAMDEQYSTLLPILPALAQACSDRPGIVLATPGDGHLVRYFTDCAVVSNNFRLTPTDLHKVDVSLRLIGSHATELPQRAPYVRYVLARLIAPAESSDPVLFAELLQPAGQLPPGFHKVATVGVNRPDGSRQDYLGVFAVDKVGLGTAVPN